MLARPVARALDGDPDGARVESAQRRQIEREQPLDATLNRQPPGVGVDDRDVVVRQR